MTSFQKVRDNLGALRILEQEALIHDQTVKFTYCTVGLILNQYKAGTVNDSGIVTVQATTFNAALNALNIQKRRFAASVALIKVPGGWDQKELPDNAMLNERGTDAERPSQCRNKSLAADSAVGCKISETFWQIYSIGGKINFSSCWQMFALGSAFFAGLTAIPGKFGVTRMNSNFTTFIRTVIILFVIVGISTFRD